MKIWVKKAVLVVMCAAMLLLLAACDSGKVSTELTIDPSFSGTRVMSFDITQSDLSKWDITGLFTPKVAEITGILKESCPEQLTMEVTESGKTSTCVFTMSFANQQEYESKVAALLGKQPTVRFEGPSDDIFISGITLAENFSSADLFGWAVDALSDKYPKAAEKLDISSADDKTVVVYDGRSPITTSAMINISPARAKLSSVEINTTRYGEDDYSREIAIKVDADNLALVGKDILTSAKLQPLVDSIEGASGQWRDDDSAYVISVPETTRDGMMDFTAAVFPGSTVSYSDLADGAFTESSALIERFDFSSFGRSFPMNEDGSINVAIIYNAGDDTIFNKDFISVLTDGKLSSDKKQLVYKYLNTLGEEISVVSETRYQVTSVSLNTDISMNGTVTESIMLGFPIENSRSASQRAERFLKQLYEDSGLAVTVEPIGVASVVSGSSVGEKNYVLIISGKGNPNKVSEMFTAAMGNDNRISLTRGSDISFTRSNSVEHSVNISSLVELAAYEGEIGYTFTTNMAKIDNAVWEDFGGNTSDILYGKTLSNTFSENKITSGGVFKIKYHYKQFNLIFVLLSLIAVVAAGCLIAVLSGTIGGRLRSGKAKKKEEARMEAVKCVALALASEEDQEKGISTLPPELIQRPLTVISPRTDEGLDEPEDEPEGVVLFNSTLKILLTSLLVLFFFPYTLVSSKVLSAKLTGLDMFMGKELFGGQLPADRISLILLLVPFILLMCLFAKKVLPRFVTPLMITIGSLFEIFYLLKLPDILDENVNVVKTMTSSFITDPSTQMQMAYTYSIVICGLLAIGGVMLMFTDLGMILTRKRREEELD